MSASSENVAARRSERAAQAELAERQRIEALKDSYGAERDAFTAKIDAALIVLGGQHQAAGEGSSAFIKRLNIDPKVLKTRKGILNLLRLYHSDGWRQHIPDFDETLFSKIFTEDERAAISKRFQGVLAPLAKSIGEAREAAKPSVSSANAAVESAQANANATRANADQAAAKAKVAGEGEKRRLEEEAKRLEEKAQQAQKNVKKAAEDRAAGGAGMPSGGSAAAAAAAASARAPPPAAEAGGFSASGRAWNFSGSSSARAPPAASAGGGAGGFTAGGGAGPWGHATASENYGGENFSAGPSRAPSAANAEWLRKMHATLDREGGKGEPSRPEAVKLPTKSLGRLESEMLARQYAAAEWAAGAPEREAAAEAQIDAEGLAALQAFQQQLRIKIALEERRQTAEQARLFRERYGERVRREDHTPYQLAIFAATRAANRRREEAAAATAAAFAPAAQAAGRSRTGENSGASSGVAPSATSSDLWLSEGLVGRMVVATSEEQELFMRNEFWEVLSNAKCKEKEKRNSFRMYGRPDENFNRFYERVKSNRRANGLSTEEPSSCTVFGGYRRQRVTRSKKGRKIQKNRRATRRH